MVISGWIFCVFCFFSCFLIGISGWIFFPLNSFSFHHLFVMHHLQLIVGNHSSTLVISFIEAGGVIGY